MKCSRARQMIESLEPRRMLAVFTGTPGNDAINIFASGSNTHVVINGQDHITGDLNITINAGEGNDAFTVASTRADSFINANGEQGNDSLVNPTVLDLDAVYPGIFNFLGGTGVDTVVADNGQDSTTSAEIGITSSGVYSGGGLRYFDIELLDYWDSNGSNRIEFEDLVTSSSAVPALNIHGNGGNDIIANFLSGDGIWATSIGANGLFIDGGAGTDTIALNNRAADSGSRFEMSSTTITLGPLLPRDVITYSSCEFVDVVANDGVDTVILNGKPSATSFRFDGLVGNDTFTVGGGDIDSNGFLVSNTTLLGGAGTDKLTFDDQLDTSSDGTTSSYTFLNPSSFINTLDKGTAGFNYTTFETQILQAANGFVSGLNTVPAVNLNAMDSLITSTTINGGPSRNCFVNVTQGNLDSLHGTLTVSLTGGGLDRLTINDQNAGGIVNAYQITDTKVLKSSTSQTINYSGVTQLTLNASNIFDVISIERTRVGTSLIVNGNAGNDLFTLGTGDVSANLLGTVALNGGAGTDSLTISNTSDTTLATQTLTASTFVDGGPTHNYSAFETLTLNEGPGGTNLTVNSISIPTTINGGDGNDAFTVGGGDIDANFPVTVAMAPRINGGGGNDSIRFDDLNDTNVDAYIFQRSAGIDQLDKDDAAIHYYINWAGIEQVTLDASNAPTTGTQRSGIFVSDIATPLRINGNAGNDVVQIFDASAPITVHTGLGGTDQLDVNFDFDTVPMTVIVDQSDDIENLAVHRPAVLRVTNGAVLTKTRTGTSPGTLSISGVLDLAGGSFLSRAGGPTTAQWRDMISRGYNAGAWNGLNSPTAGAINSSLAAASPLPDAVGYGLGAEIAPTTIGPFSIAAGDTLMRYTYYGDADLNGVVDFDDYSRTDAGFNNNRSGWVNGDFDYNNVVDFDDYSLIDLAFNTQSLRGRLSWR